MKGIEKMQDEQPSILIRNLLEVFNERDPSKRGLAIQDLYTDDAIFFEPENAFTGHAAINQQVTEVLQTLPPEALFQATGPMTSNHDVARVSWTLGVPNGPVLASGIDVGVLDGDRIAKLYLFFDAQPT